jgi:alpha-acetolactate decarboxylase
LLSVVLLPLCALGEAVLYQVSTCSADAGGLLRRGDLTSWSARRHRLGTFDSLDGEMIVLDARVPGRYDAAS